MGLRRLARSARRHVVARDRCRDARWRLSRRAVAEQPCGTTELFSGPDPETGAAQGAAPVPRLSAESALSPASGLGVPEPTLTPTAVTLRDELTLPTVSIWPAEALRALGVSDNGAWPAASPEDYDELLRRIAAEERDSGLAEAGWNAAFDKLAGLVAG